MFTQESTFQENKAALNKEQCVHFAVHVAKSVLHIYEEQYPGDDRPRKAIEAAEQWLIDKNTDPVRAAANAARAAFSSYTADAASAGWAAAFSAVNAGQNWQWINKLYSSIHKEQPFPKSWKTRDTISIAKDMLASRNLKDMPILADALEDAGCTDSEILYHLRNDKDLWCPGDWVLVNLGV